MRKLKDTKAFDLSIAAIRTAQGKGNPENFAAGSTEWQSAQLGVMQDTLRILDLLRIEERRSQRRGIGTAGDIPSEG